jgi:hypothetical protein
MRNTISPIDELNAGASQSLDSAGARAMRADKTGMLKEMPARYNGDLKDMASTDK